MLDATSHMQPHRLNPTPQDGARQLPAVPWQRAPSSQHPAPPWTAFVCGTRTRARWRAGLCALAHACAIVQVCNQACVITFACSNASLLGGAHVCLSLYAAA